jgi:hypothetical protein
MKRHILFALPALLALPASAAWTVSATGAPSGCTHVISDGNWQIGVYRYADDNWRLGKNGNGSSYISGSGDLDLRSLEADCGVVLKTSSNGGMEANANITSVWFPDSLVEMVGGTFNRDTALTNAVFGTGIRKIGYNAFWKCSNLKTVNFPEGLTTIGDYAFSECSSLVMPEGGFPESLGTLDSKAFQSCNSLVVGRLDMKNVSNIVGVAHFENCKQITDVYAPLVTYVSDYMFCNASALTNAVFSPDVSYIGYSAFYNDGNLVSFYPSTLPRLETIGGQAFRSDKKLSVSFDFSQSKITTVPTYALVDLHKVMEMRFPETLVSLASESLAYNASARRVVWFAGPPPTLLNGNDNAMWPGSTSGRWVLVAGKKHASEWKADERLLPLEESDYAASDFPGRESVKNAIGLHQTQPIGKWKSGTMGATFWVVEELPAETMLLVK